MKTIFIPVLVLLAAASTASAQSKLYQQMEQESALRRALPDPGIEMNRRNADKAQLDRIEAGQAVSPLDQIQAAFLAGGPLDRLLLAARNVPEAGGFVWIQQNGWDPTAHRGNDPG